VTVECEDMLDHADKVLDICEGETWPEVAGKLSRYFHWEYEDYQQV
jgi:Immunity protein 8